jgi:hypothetical protein
MCPTSCPWCTAATSLTCLSLQRLQTARTGSSWVRVAPLPSQEVPHQGSTSMSNVGGDSRRDSPNPASGARGQMHSWGGYPRWYFVFCGRSIFLPGSCALTAESTRHRTQRMHPLHTSKGSLQLLCTHSLSYRQQTLQFPDPCILLIVNIFLTFVGERLVHSNIADCVKLIS